MKLRNQIIIWNSNQTSVKTENKLIRYYWPNRQLELIRQLQLSTVVSYYIDWKIMWLSQHNTCIKKIANLYLSRVSLFFKLNLPETSIMIQNVLLFQLYTIKKKVKFDRFIIWGSIKCSLKLDSIMLTKKEERNDCASSFWRQSEKMMPSIMVKKNTKKLSSTISDSLSRNRIHNIIWKEIAISRRWFRSI